MALPPTNDTICAIATAPGSGAIGIVRVSGPGAYAVADRLFVSRSGRRPSRYRAGRVVYGRVVEGALAGRLDSGPKGLAGSPREPAVERRGQGRARKETVDEALLLTFRGPASYTGQDVVELQTHGGPAVLRRVLELCVAAGARLAGPGEFTLRAYLNGRLDLAQAEGVLELVNASTQSARRNATSGLSGELSRRIDLIQTAITSAYAAVQAAFDYPEEGVPEAQLEEPLIRAIGLLDELLATADAGRLSRHGARLALLGRPNAGKSSLLNALLGYERSLVSDVPGTTRDYLEAPLVIAGVPLTLIDTAGIRVTQDRLEASGVDLTHQVSEAADLRVVLVDRSQALSEVDEELLGNLAGQGAARPKAVVVASKADLEGAWDERELARKLGSVPVIAVSAVTSLGLAELKERLAATLLGDAASAELWIANERHVQALERAREHVLAALEGSHDLVALELQDAITSLASITGRDGVAEETLAQIFASFCVGK